MNFRFLLKLFNQKLHKTRSKRQDSSQDCRRLVGVSMKKLQLQYYRSWRSCDRISSFPELWEKRIWRPFRPKDRVFLGDPVRRQLILSWKPKLGHSPIFSFDFHFGIPSSLPFSLLAKCGRSLKLCIKVTAWPVLKPSIGSKTKHLFT